ncbi:hypothetical protein [Chitinophaga nivalis]|uniref:Uncharacterized protein n=1 Tax=Chitinophaga nivalis TaxID=2991709 RepID=A0ABT3INK9_9BACT|nr:hypothetical protein [Chitinophaga nivalis]MCW3464741.1 hypothetical protein [Chitinophaga nivalis]MCW3485568.1 hypothetical protein [Chitinophaga nivalis]
MLNTSNDNIGLIYSAARSKVVDVAVLVERLLSIGLSHLLSLGCGDFKNVHVDMLGDISKKLPFNQIITLLVHIKAIKKEDEVKFRKLIEIRNVFLRDPLVITFSACLKVRPNLQKFLSKEYLVKIENQQNTSLENFTEMYFECFFKDVSNISNTIMWEYVIGKACSKGFVEGQLQYYKILIQKIREFVSQNPDSDLTSKITMLMEEAATEAKKSSIAG